jgi:hypothetical protein
VGVSLRYWIALALALSGCATVDASDRGPGRTLWFVGVTRVVVPERKRRAWTAAGFPLRSS